MCVHVGWGAGGYMYVCVVTLLQLEVFTYALQNCVNERLDGSVRRFVS